MKIKHRSKFSVKKTLILSIYIYKNMLCNTIPEKIAPEKCFMRIIEGWKMG